MEKLIVIKQLPVIEQKLKALSTEIDSKVKKALSLVCSEDTVKSVKVVRASLNADFKEVDEQRKEVKEKILEPYNAFESLYSEYIGAKYKDADLQLKTKINEVENGLKQEKKESIIKYFDKYRDSKNNEYIQFITFDMSKIQVTLTSSIKSLKDNCNTFIDKVVEDISLLLTQEYFTEMLIEYKQTLDVAKSMNTVLNRIKQIEVLKETESKPAIPTTNKTFPHSKGLMPPIVAEKDKYFVYSFKVKCTEKEKENLINYFAENDIKYKEL